MLLLLGLQVGGLGDVVTSLAKAHQATGTLVEVVLPKYDCANYGCVGLQCGRNILIIQQDVQPSPV